MWITKHRPKTLNQITGNPKLIADLRDYDWKTPLILYGGPGTGKSMIAEALAKELNFEIVQVTNDNIKSASAMSQTASVFGGKKLIIIDNVDRIRNIKEVGELAKETKNPLLMITSDFSSKKLATLKRRCQKAQIRKPTARTIQKILKNILDTEDIIASDDVLETIAQNSQGDIRSAINDLESISLGRKTIKTDDLKILENRDRKGDIYNALSKILTKKDFDESRRSTYDLTEQPKDILLWVDENTPHIYTHPEDIRRAYENLAKADRFIGRITSRQYWGFLRYANTLMSGGVTASKKNPIKYSMYRFPSYLITMSKAKKEKAIKKEIAQKMAPYLHASTKVITREYIPLFRILLKQDRIKKEDLIKTYSLGDDEIGYLIA